MRPPDLLVTAAQLPLMSGLDLIRYVRNRSGMASMPVIGVYDDRNAAARESLQSAGASETLSENTIDVLLLPLLQAALRRADQFMSPQEIQRARLPQNEEARLESLRKTKLLDTDREERFDTITRLAAGTFNTPIATITLIDKDRQWFKASEGLANRETHRDQAFCAHTILDSDVMVVPDAVLDPRFSENPLVTGDPTIRFYAGAPVSAADGHQIGTLCVIDRTPRAFSERDKQTLKDFAKLVEREIAHSAA